MFRNDRQRSAVARTLLRSLHLDYLWQDNGPTDAACEFLEDRGSPLSSGEALMLLIAFDVWNGDGKAERDWKPLKHPYEPWHWSLPH